MIYLKNNEYKDIDIIYYLLFISYLFIYLFMRP